MLSKSLLDKKPSKHTMKTLAILLLSMAAASIAQGEKLNLTSCLIKATKTLLCAFLSVPNPPFFDKLLVAGGRTRDNTLASVELVGLSGAADCAKPADLPEPRFRAGGALVNGRARICGGFNEERLETLSDCLEYNPDGDVWLQLNAGLPYPAEAFASSLIGGNRWVITGGTNGASVYDDTLVLDADLGIWTPGFLLPVPLFFHSQTTIDESSIFVTGGFTADGSFNTRAWILDVNDGSVLEVPRSPWARSLPCLESFLSTTTTSPLSKPTCCSWRTASVTGSE